MRAVFSHGVREANQVWSDGWRDAARWTLRRAGAVFVPEAERKFPGEFTGRPVAIGALDFDAAQVGAGG